MPDTPRGVTKLAASMALAEWAEETGVPFANLRLFSVYGPGESRGRIVPELLHALRNDAPFKLPSVPSRRDFINVADVVTATVRAIDVPAPSEVLNVGTGVETTVEELIALAEEVTGNSLKIAEDTFPRRPSDREHSRADTSRTFEILGWKASIPLREGLADMWNRW